MQGSVLCAARRGAAAPGSSRILPNVRHRVRGAVRRCSSALTRMSAIQEAPAAASEEVRVLALLASTQTAVGKCAAPGKGSAC